MKPLNLSPREKNYIAIAAGVIGIFLFIQLIVAPVLKKSATLERIISTKSDDLAEMRVLQSEYLTIKKAAERAKTELVRREKGFSPISFLDRLAEKVNIKVASVKTSSSKEVAGVKVVTLQLKIEAITTEQLVNYLYQVEYSGNNLTVNRMSISKTSKPDGYINVVLQIETIES
jgi:type II secretory pathway component PulM